MSYADERAFEILTIRAPKGLHRKREREPFVSVNANMKQLAYQFTLTQVQSSIPTHRLQPTQR
jgi:hypothetical protein